MTPIYLASGNAHKAEEIAAMFRDHGLSNPLFSANAIGGLPDVDENAGTFAGNALLKAQALAKQAPDVAWVLADDRGLQVDALDGDPGVYSARYAGVGATDVENTQKLITTMNGIGESERKARFICVLVLLRKGATQGTSFEGSCEGHIIEEQRGDQGFGYDPVFVPDGYDKTFAELGPSIKDKLSHRARAVEKLIHFLKLDRP